MKTALLALIPLLFGGWFRSCVEHQPARTAHSDPSFFSRQADRFWERLAVSLVEQVQARRGELQGEIKKLAGAFPKGSVDLPQNHEDEMATTGTYGQLPEVRVDVELGAIFPVPLSDPSRYSWYQVAVSAAQIAEAINHFETGFRQWKALAPAERESRFGEVTDAWEHIETLSASLAQQVRYLSTWVPQLTRQWQESAGGSKPVQYLLTSAIEQGDPRLMDALREVLRPARVLKRSFLPSELHEGTVTIPIATDVTSRRFLAEIEGALDTHWNQSSWARNQGVRFAIRWTFVPKDRAFVQEKVTLDEHLAKFPPEQAALTTGGLTTYVRGKSLVLGPGKINPRTLAHELGHLMGFTDCYLRTLSGQGIFGTAVLEWDNPLYPDDIMCDNTVGAARAEAW